MHVWFQFAENLLMGEKMFFSLDEARKEIVSGILTSIGNILYFLCFKVLDVV
jgi:hypothetical protein